MCALGAKLDIVCHQIRSPDNLGSIARLMANFGFTRLILSDPATHGFRDAAKMAVGAERVLETLSVATGLKDALAQSVYAVGSTSRAPPRRKTISPEEAARRLAGEAERGRVALVLGGEKRGLSDEELAFCQDVLVIPTRPEQPSMNLAQAAAVLLYLCAREGEEEVVGAKEPGAPAALLAQIEEVLGRVLLRVEFLNPQAPEHALRELMRSLTRAALSRREAEMWLSAARHLDRKT